MPNQISDPRIERLNYDTSEKNVANALTVIRKNFESLANYFDKNGQFDGFTHLEFTVPNGATQVKIKHGLGFVPKDILITRIIAPSGVKLTLHHDLFDSESICVSAGAGDIKVRLLVGTYKNSSTSPESLEAGSNQEVKAIL